MIRPILCFAGLVLLTITPLRAQTLAHSPLNPRPGESVTLTLFTHSCAPLLDTAVVPPGAGNGSIRFTIAGPCDCIATPLPMTFTEEVGPLQLGTYNIDLLSDGCVPPALLSRSALTVSRNGAVVALGPQPARPVLNQPLTVGFDAFCPLAMKEPRIEPSSSETLIVLDQDPEAPVPAAPCTPDPSWAVRFPLAGLALGTYRLRVRMGESSASLETVAEAVFAVVPTGPALSLRHGRFRVWVDWSAPGFGEGSAQAVPLTDESGYFTFFGPSNVELVAKVLNGCPVNQRYWVFLAGLTNVGVTVQVEDTVTGHLETYVNSPGKTFQPVLDTSRFATCP
jgi:hypothetical protein